MYVDNICIINGSAKVMSTTSDTVKIQLYGDRSEINAIFGDKYIDELALPYNYDSSSARFGGSRSSWVKDDDGYKQTTANGPKLTWADEGFSKFVYVQINDETQDAIRNMQSGVSTTTGAKELYSVKESIQFNLLYCVKSVFNALGYNCDVSQYDIEPYNHIIIANARKTAYMNCILPHWTIKEFIEQIQYFFRCSFIFDSASLHVTMWPVSQTSNNNLTMVNPSDDFSVEISDESDLKSINSSNIQYQLSDSAYHDNDYISEEKAGNLPIKLYNSYTELAAAYAAMSDNDKGYYLLRCPDGDYCEWTYSGTTSGDVIKSLIQVNHFRDLIRTVDDNMIDLKIVPVAMADAVEVPLYVEYKPTGTTNHSSGNYFVKTSASKSYQVMPSMAGQADVSGTFGGQTDSSSTPAEGPTDIQDNITGSDETSSESKPDRIEVFFYDGKTQMPTKLCYSGDETGVAVPSVFTAWNLKNINCQEHEHWSFSLYPNTSTLKTVGGAVSKDVINDKQKYTIKFLSDNIPSANDIFIINNKRFMAEKIEINIKRGEIDRLMTGYFYEIVQ
jgi:hypothetical protein